MKVCSSGYWACWPSKATRGEIRRAVASAFMTSKPLILTCTTGTVTWRRR